MLLLVAQRFQRAPKKGLTERELLRGWTKGKETWSCVYRRRRHLTPQAWNPTGMRHKVGTTFKFQMEPWGLPSKNHPALPHGGVLGGATLGRITADCLMVSRNVPGTTVIRWLWQTWELSPQACGTHCLSPLFSLSCGFSDFTKALSP